MLIISTLDYPDMIEIRSTGPAAEMHPNQMGDYKLDNTKTAQLRKVYKKTDRDYYIFYSGNFYYDDNVGVIMFIISGTGHWTVGYDITGDGGWLSSEEQGLLTPPRTGWTYSDGNGGWASDDTLQLMLLI